jgi:gamma-glutamyltranspeptidase/glutathione hydrolase
MAREHILNEQQSHFLDLIHPITTLMPEGRKLYEPGGVYLVPGSKMRNPDCADFIEQLVHDRGQSFYSGEIAGLIDRDMAGGGGFLTAEDLTRYTVLERKPLKIPYRNYQLYTSPGPSMGGTLIGLSIGLTERLGTQEYSWGSGQHLKQTVGLMQEVERLKTNGISNPDELQKFLDDEESYTPATENIRLFSRGTTHVSISDKDGNCASMTCSNGEGSGYFAPGTGIMLNNMMGEDDLHPDGFHTSDPGIRVGSMMSPSLLAEDGRVKLVVGSGGSKRIRTSVSQVLSQIVDFNRTIREAVSAPRLYWDGNVVQVEPGFQRSSIDMLKQVAEVNIWDRLDVYFGGVHAVAPGEDGVGDVRRGGAVSIVEV